MKAMKNMMEGMMPTMMKGVSSEEKQEMMLKMMPLMMEDIDMAEFMPKMMASMLPALLPQMLEMINDPKMGDRMLDAMSTMMPNMCGVIDKSALAEKKDAMVHKLMEREGFRKNMPACFAKGMPLMVRGCFEHFMPELSKEERIRFIGTLVQMMFLYGAGDFTADDKKALLAGYLE